MENFRSSKAKTSKTKTPEYLLDKSFVFVFSRQSISVASAECLKSVKRSKTKTSKAKTLKTKTPEYLLDESFVFVFLPTVHFSCQCGMSKKCLKFEK